VGLARVIYDHELRNPEGGFMSGKHVDDADAGGIRHKGCGPEIGDLCEYRNVRGGKIATCNELKGSK
jgi:hypothetical protein